MKKTDKNKMIGRQFLPVQLRIRNFGPYTGRTQSFQQYSIGQAASDAAIKRSA